MRSNRPFRFFGSASGTNLHVDEAPAPKPPAELPPSMKFALIYMRRNGNELCGKVASVMRAMGAEWNVLDLDQLRALGFLDRPHGSHHVLTDTGRREADRLAKEIARDYPVHHITFSFKLPKSNTGSFASCACGDWRLTVTRKRGDDDRLLRSAAAHMESVKNGTWKRHTPAVTVELHFKRHLVSGAGISSTGVAAPGNGAIGDAYQAPVASEVGNA